MTRKIRFSGFPEGEQVSLAASQGGVSRGPVTISAWKSAPASSVSASVSRYPIGNVLPGEVVTFYVTATSGFTGSDEYEELDFEWDFGDSGATYSVAQDLPYSDANTEYGRVVAHAYTTTGAKTVTVTLRDHATGQVGTATIPVTVDDPDSDIAWDNDIYVSFAGNFGGAPAAGGAVQHVSDIATLTGLSLSGNTRITFRKGETFAWNTTTLSIPGRSYITSRDTFGSGTRPKITGGPYGTSGSGSAIFNPGNGGGNSHIAFYGVDFDGGYDPVTGSYASGSGKTKICGTTGPTNGSELYRSFCQVQARGMAATYAGAGTLVSTQDGETFLGFSDVDITDWMNYGLHFQNVDLIIGVTGCSIRQNPLALLADNKLGTLTEAADHGPIRIHGIKYGGITNCALASTSGWSGLENDNVAQPCIRWNAGHDLEGATPYTLSTGNIQRNKGFAPVFLDVGESGGDYQPLHAIVCDRNDFTHTRHHQAGFANLSHPGIYIRNNVYYCANVGSVIAQKNQFVGLSDIDPATKTLEAGRDTKPIVMSFNTMVSDRSSASSNTNTVNFLNIVWWNQTAPTQENNIVEVPNHSNAGDFTDYKPLDRAGNFKPVTGSAAINAVSSGTIPVRDFEGNLRGATTNVGAHDTESASAGTVTAPSYTSGLTIAERTVAAGEYHVTDFGTWNNWSGDDRYMVEWEWRIDGVAVTEASWNFPAQASETNLYWLGTTSDQGAGDLTCVITATNRSGQRVSAHSENSVTLV